MQGLSIPYAHCYYSVKNNVSIHTLHRYLIIKNIVVIICLECLTKLYTLIQINKLILNYLLLKRKISHKKGAGIIPTPDNDYSLGIETE